MIEIGGKTIDSIYIGAKEVQKIEIGGKIAYEKSAPIDYMYIENTYAGQNTITFTTTTAGSPSSADYASSIEYSKDKNSWTTLTFDTTTPQTVTINQGEKLYLRNDGGKFNYCDGTNSYYTTITGSETHDVGGDILSIYDYNAIDTNPTITKSGCFYGLFVDNAKLVNSNGLKVSFVNNSNYIFRSFCNRCTSLVNPADFSGLTGSFTSYGFIYIYNYCSSMSSAPNFGGLTGIVKTYSFYQGFRGCSFTNPPDFSGISGNIEDYGISNTFVNCTSLLYSPDFSGVTGSVGSSGLSDCLNGCTSLLTAPDLSGVTTVGANGLYRMFNGCTSLEQSPDLSGVTTISGNGLKKMLYGCSKIRTAPDLKKVTSVGSNGLQDAFYGCSRLNTAYAPTISSWSTTNFRNWLGYVANTGTLYSYGEAEIPTNNISGCPSGWTISTTPPDYLYVENTYSGQNTITLTTDDWGGSTSPHSTSVQYSKDKTTWTTVNFSSTPATITLDQGEKLYFRNNTGAFNTLDYSTTITGSQSHIVGGDPRSLLDYTDISNTALVYGCFCNLFKNDTTLTSAAQMTTPTDVAEGSYRYCFAGCTAMTDGPWLNATVLDDYSYAHMFDGCSSLNEIRCEATDISATDCTIDWVNGVAVSGTFYDYGSPGFTSGPSGTPAGWTIITSQVNPS